MQRVQSIYLKNSPQREVIKKAKQFARKNKLTFSEVALTSIAERLLREKIYRENAEREQEKAKTGY